MNYVYLIGLLISTAMAAVVAPAPAPWLPGCPEDACILKACESCITIPLPRFPAIKDFFLCGELTVEYRNKLRVVAPFLFKCLPATISYICFEGTSVTGLSFKCYKQVVIETINCVETAPCYNGEDLDRVLRFIYDAACCLKANQIDLLCFTAVGMHNMFSFCKFVGSTSDESIGWVCRGLLQIKSQMYYEKLSSYRDNKGKCYNYISQPSMLNRFSKQSIFDEFRLFLDEFKPRGKRGSSTMPDIIRYMAPIEARLINGELCLSDCDLVAKMNRRCRIFDVLYDKILCTCDTPKVY